MGFNIIIPLYMHCTICGFASHIPKQYKLYNYPQIHLLSHAVWKPGAGIFHNCHQSTIDKELQSINHPRVKALISKGRLFDVSNLSACIIAITRSKKDSFTTLDPGKNLKTIITRNLFTTLWIIIIHQL